MKKFMALLLALLMASSLFSFAGAEDPLQISGMIVLYQQAPAEDSDFWKWMESTFNVDYTVEWVPESGYSDKLSIALNTGDLPDIIQVTSTTDASVVNAANDGTFYDLTPLLDWEKYPNLAKLNEAAWTNSKINGKNYFLPRTRGQYNTCYFLRKDILDEKGLAVPHTVSEFTEYLRAVKELHPEMVPLAYQMQYISDNVLGAFGEGAIIPAYTEDGEGIVFEHLTEAYVKMVEWLQGLYKEGLLASEFSLYNTDKNHDLFLSGKGGIRHQNLWHRWRLEHSVQEAVPGSSIVPMFYITSDDGKYVHPQYDIGFYGGLAINADLPEEKVVKILEFMDKTADPELYNTFRYGLPEVHWTMVDGFPALNEKGKAEVTNSFYGPFCLATNLYDKVDSPLATPAYNLESREMAKDVDKAAAMIDGSPIRLFAVLKSNTWSAYWAVEKPQFDAFVAETIAGAHTLDELRDYQARIKAVPEVQEGFREFKASYEDFGLGSWKPAE